MSSSPEKDGIHYLPHEEEVIPLKLSDQEIPDKTFSPNQKKDNDKEEISHRKGLDHQVDFCESYDDSSKASPEHSNNLNNDTENCIPTNNKSEGGHGIIDEKKLHRKILFILIAVNVLAFVSSFSYWMQSGVLPYLTRKLGVTPIIFGYMQSSYAFYQMITSPLFGRLGDVIGVKFVYILSEVGASIAYGSLAFANSIPALFLTRVPALLMHGLQCAYMVITDVTMPDTRADMLGKLGVSHGIGMIVGAFVGGLVTEALNEKAAALLASSGNILSVCIVCVLIPTHTKPIRKQLDDIQRNKKNTSNSPTNEHNISENVSINRTGNTSDRSSNNKTSPHRKSGLFKRSTSKTNDEYSRVDKNNTEPLSTRTEMSDNSPTSTVRSKSGANSKENDSRGTPKISSVDNGKVTLGLKEIIYVLKYPNLKFLLFIKMIIAFPYSLIYSMFSMAVMDYYHLGPKINGILLAYIGGLGIFVQGILIAFLTKRFSDYFNIKLAIFLSMIGFMFLIISRNVNLLVMVVLPIITGGSVSHILLMTIITKVVHIEDTGTALGLVFALHAVVRSFAPTTGGQIFTHIGWPFFGVIGYVIHMGIMVYVLLYGEKEDF